MEQLTLKTAQSLGQAWRGDGMERSSLFGRGVELALAVRAKTFRLLGRAKRLTDLLVDVEITTREEAVERLAELAAARRDAEHWKVRTERFAERIADLEQEVAASRIVATDLRARLVCLHSKLAATTATARYQRSTSALETRKA